MSETSMLRSVPASFFGIVLGLVGLGDCWRFAYTVWGVPQVIGEIVMLIAVATWAILVTLYLFKWLTARDNALAEWRHPVQSCFIGLGSVATMLAAVAIGPYSHTAAVTLFQIGAALDIAYGLFFMGRAWAEPRDHSTTTGALYLPTVAGNFVAGFVAGYLGFHDLAVLFFGAGALCWLAIESVIVHRLVAYDTLPVPLRATMGIMLAPPVVGCVAYLFITSGTPDLVAKALLGYGLLQLLLLLRLLPWICKQPFGAPYWAFSFGVTALAFDSIVFVQRGLTGLFEPLAIVLFVFANIVMAVLAIGTLALLLRGKLVPMPSKV